MRDQDQARRDSGSSQERHENSAYEPPRLDLLGSVEELTTSGNSTGCDDFCPRIS